MPPRDTCDEANQRQLLSGLNGYQKAEGHFPQAASGAAVLAADTRLSWIATLLPYYGHGDWHRRLEFGYGWNSRRTGRSRSNRSRRSSIRRWVRRPTKAGSR